MLGPAFSSSTSVPWTLAMPYIHHASDLLFEFHPSSVVPILLLLVEIDEFLHHPVNLVHICLLCLLHLLGLAGWKVECNPLWPMGNEIFEPLHVIKGIWKWDPFPLPWHPRAFLAPCAWHVTIGELGSRLPLTCLIWRSRALIAPYAWPVNH
jgi:hypothetical protein